MGYKQNICKHAIGAEINNHTKEKKQFKNCAKKKHLHAHNKIHLMTKCNGKFHEHKPNVCTYIKTAGECERHGFVVPTDFIKSNPHYEEDQAYSCDGLKILGCSFTQGKCVPQLTKPKTPSKQTSMDGDIIGFHY